jgi:hypothetical protein
MYVYGNGMWHDVKSKEVRASITFLHTRCGITFTGESATANDPSILSSSHFCDRCIREIRNEDSSDTNGGHTGT